MIKASGPTYYSAPSETSDEKRAMREANAVLQGSWKMSDANGDFLILLIGLTLGLFLVLSQSC